MLMLPEQDTTSFLFSSSSGREGRLGGKHPAKVLSAFLFLDSEFRELQIPLLYPCSRQYECFVLSQLPFFNPIFLNHSHGAFTSDVGSSNRQSKSQIPHLHVGLFPWTVASLLRHSTSSAAFLTSGVSENHSSLFKLTERLIGSPKGSLGEVSRVSAQLWLQSFFKVASHWGLNLKGQVATFAYWCLASKAFLLTHVFSVF